jgi:hypothetical protein
MFTHNKQLKLFFVIDNLYIIKNIMYHLRQEMPEY